jgi:hypothetical protein
MSVSFSWKIPVRSEHTLTHMAQNLCRREDLVCSNFGVLDDFPVDASDQPPSLRRRFIPLCTDEGWTNGGEFVESFGVEELARTVSLNLEEPT